MWLQWQSLFTPINSVVKMRTNGVSWLSLFAVEYFPRTVWLLPPIPWFMSDLLSPYWISHSHEVRLGCYYTRWDWGVTTPVTSNVLSSSARNSVQVMEEFCLFVFLSMVLGFSSRIVKRPSEVDEQLILPFLLLPSPNPSLVQVLRKLPSSTQCPLQLSPIPWPEHVVLGAWSAAPAMTRQTWRTARPGNGVFVETTSNIAPSSWKNSWVRRGSAKTCGPRWTSTTPMLASRWGAALEGLEWI